MDSVPHDLVMQRHPSLQTVVQTAANTPVSLVGGTVRDLLLDRDDGADIDLVVEGDAIAIAHAAARTLGADVRGHPRFGTAEIHLPAGRWIDLVSARTEAYAQPGALPTVAPAMLTQDLERRDITINAMAVPLNGPDAGRIIDPWNGRADLANKLIRLIHPESLVDDPSRLLRAVRYAARLGFALADDTKRQARAAAPHLDLTRARNGDELTRTLIEPTAAAALHLLRDLGVGWLRPDDLSDAFARLDAALRSEDAPHIEPWHLRLGAALTPDALALELALDAGAVARARSMSTTPQLVDALEGATRNSEIDRLLRSATPSAAVAAHATSAPHVEQWWRTMRHPPALIRGTDLIAQGVTAGPAVGRALAFVRAQVLDGQLSTERDAQIAAALDYIRTDG